MSFPDPPRGDDDRAAAAADSDPSPWCGGYTAPAYSTYAVTDRLDRDSAGGCWVVRAAVAAADSAAAVAAADSAAAVASVAVDAADSAAAVASAVAAADSAADVADSSIVSTI